MKPWRKLYTRRSPRFEAQPVVARGLFLELLSHVDDGGWIRLGTSDRGTLWRFIAAHPNERRMLSRHLDMLLAIGSVEVAEDGWRLPSFGGYQGLDGGPAQGSNVPPASVQPAPVVLPTCAGRASGVSAIEAKSSKPLEPDRQRRGREEVDKRGPPPDPPPIATAPVTPDDVLAVESSLARSSRLAMARAVEAAGGEYQRSDRPEHVEAGRTVAQWAAKRSVPLDATLAQWAGDWIKVAKARSARSWLSYVAARAAGTTWAQGSGRSRAAGVVPMRAAAVQQDFGDADIPGARRVS